jgi:hypothetical protein
MSNLEENLPSNDNNPGGGSDANETSSGAASGNSESSENTNSGQPGNEPLDPQHNTGHEHMRIDEEGAEVGPDDEV